MEQSESPKRPSLTIVVPVYNGEAALAELVTRLGAILPGLAEKFEVLLVNDGSRDRSWACISELARKHRYVRGIDLMRNYGQHNALLAGVRAARGDVIVTMDDDLQHPPEEIARLLAALTDEWDVIYGTPKDLPHSLGRNIASWLTKLVLQNVMGASTARRVDAFRAFRTELRTGFARYGGPFISLDVLLTWSTARFSSVTVEYQPRRQGQSNYTFLKLVTHAVNMMTGFSTIPLQIASVVGFAFTAFGLGVLAFVVVRSITEGGAPAGFPFLASIVAIFSGAQLFALGIIGEYLARLHFRMMERPPYVVRRELP